MKSLSPLQSRALDEVAAWLRDPNRKPVFRLFGYAGSGKTTLAKLFAEMVEGRVYFAAFTGKAASVLRAKGCAGAQTIHSLIYRPAGDPATVADFNEWKRELADGPKLEARRLLLVKLIEGFDPKRRGPRFALDPNAACVGAKLIVVDECSMVDRRIGEDLESFGVPILVLGDPAQLPPVGGGGYFTDAEPDFLLDEVHRQAEESPVLWLATRVRRRESITYGPFGDGCEILRYGNPTLGERAQEANMILVGRNNTRHASNTRMRSLLGRGAEPFPVIGDRAVALRNDHEVGLLNGTTWSITHAVADADNMTIGLEMDADDGGSVQCTAWLHHFMGREAELGKFGAREHQEVDYGYALTVHKSQGSQWDDVLLFDESSSFGKDGWRHLYTGITRAAKRLTVVR